MGWRKIIGWGVAALVILFVLGIAGGLLFLRTASFQRLAIRTIVNDTDAATGARAEIGHLDLELSTLTAHLYDITVHGKESGDEPPLLHARQTDRWCENPISVAALLHVDRISNRASGRAPPAGPQWCKQSAPTAPRPQHQ